MLAYKRGVKILSARVINNHFSDYKVGCRISIDAKSKNKVLDKEFWPERIKCREWSQKKESNSYSNSKNDTHGRESRLCYHQRDESKCIICYDAYDNEDRYSEYDNRH